MRYARPLRFLFLFALFASTAAAQPFSVGRFRPWAGYKIPNGVWLTGDFNRDNRADLFHAVDGTDVANTWIAFGDGSYSARTFRPWPGYAIPNGVWLTGDFDDDDDTDVLHIDDANDVANAWLSNSDGTFNVRAFTPWAGYKMPNGVWLTGDYDNDGRTDAFHAVQGTDVAHVWFSNGDGTFRVTAFRPWEGYAIPNGTWMGGDFNGDLRADVVHLDDANDLAHVWLSNGDGTFAVRVFSPWGGYLMPNGVWLTGDFDRNGQSDLLHAVDGAESTNVWLSNGDGTFRVNTFQPWPGYETPNGVWIAGDWNADNRTDVLHAVDGAELTHVWLSNGDGTFRVSTFQPWSGYETPHGQWFAGDFTLDGKADVVHVVDGADYVHPWTSLMANPQQVFLQGLEVTQAVQSLAHDVPLVAGRTTVVRAYLDAPAEGGPVAVQGELSIRDLATGVVSTIASTAATTLDPAQNGQLQTKRNALPLSLNFALQPVLATGGRQFSLTSVTPAAGGPPIGCSNCGAAPVTVPFVPSAPLRLRMVGLRYNTGVPPMTTVNQPAPADFALLQSWLGRTYPVPQVIATQTTILSENGWPFNCDDANAQLQAMRVAEVGMGMDDRTHYLGLVSNGGGFMRGCSAGTPDDPDPTVVASGPVGMPGGPAVPVNAVGDTDASFGDWYGGHELAHTLGRYHPGFCNRNSSEDGDFPYPNGQISDNANTYVGWDAGDAANGIGPSALPGMTTTDIMTYCNQPQWLSAYAYAGVRDRLNAENPAMTLAAAAPQTALLPAAEPALDAPPAVHTGGRRPARAVAGGKALAVPKAAASRPRAAKPDATPASPAPAMASAPPVVNFIHLPRTLEAPEDGPAPVMQEGRLVSIVATVNLTRSTGQIRYVQHVPRAIVPPPPAAGEQAVLRFTDRSGGVLGEYPQAVRISSDVQPGEDRTGQVAAIVPELEGVARIELLHRGTVLDRLEIPERAPKVIALRFHAPPARREPTLEWKGKTDGAAPLRYLVHVSPDGRTGWQVLAVGTTATELPLTSEQWEQYAGWFARVIANDGYNDSEPEVTRLRKGQE